MSNSKSSAPGSDAYISLRDAFVSLGKAVFREDWDQDCLRLGSGSYWHDLEIPTLYDPTKIEPEKQKEIADFEFQGLISRASKTKRECYYGTLDKILSCLWKSEFQAVGILKDGSVQEIENTVWKNDTGIYNISIADSRVYVRKGKSRETWEVSIDRKKFDPVLAKAVRVAASLVNTSTSGRPPKFKPLVIARINNVIAQVHADSNYVVSINRCYRRCDEIMRKERWDKENIPKQTTLKYLIKEYKKSFDIN